MISLNEFTLQIIGENFRKTVDEILLWRYNHFNIRTDWEYNTYKHT